MKKTYWGLLLAALTWAACTESPIDEDGLLVTGRSECYVGSFELLGFDHKSVLNTVSVDTVTQEIRGEVFYGTDMKHLYPQFSLVTDAKLEPKITGAVDFSDLEHPRKWTVVSGNRRVRKEYTVYLSVQQPN